MRPNFNASRSLNSKPTRMSCAEVNFQSILRTAGVMWSLRTQKEDAGEVKLKLECVILELH
jgi:hypothetical protein